MFFVTKALRSDISERCGAALPQPWAWSWNHLMWPVIWLVLDLPAACTTHKHPRIPKLCDRLQLVNSLWDFTVFVNSILGSWSEDNIYTNVWSILNHKIEKTTCQQVPSVKLIFTGPWNLCNMLSFLQSLSSYVEINQIITDKTSSFYWKIDRV